MQTLALPVTLALGCTVGREQAWFSLLLFLPIFAPAGCSGPSEPSESCTDDSTFRITFVQNDSTPFVDFASARLCSTCYAKDYGPELCHCFVVDRKCNVLEGDQDLAYPACQQGSFTLLLDRESFPATTIALSIRDATGKVVYADTTDASVVHQGEPCSGPADASFYFNYEVLGSGGGAGTSNP